MPKYIDAVSNDAAQELYENSVCVPYDKISVLEALEEFREVEIKDSNGSPTENLIYNMRKDNTCSWLFIAHGAKEENVSAEDTSAQNVTIYISGEYSPLLYDTLSGEICEIPYTYEKGKTVIGYTLYRNDSILLKLTEEKGTGVGRINEKALVPSQTIRFIDEMEYKRCEPNVLLLDRAEYSLNGEPFNNEEEILILDNKCRERMGWPLRIDQFAQPWVVKEEPISNYITLRFNINSEVCVSGARLAIEDAEKLEIMFNGEKIPVKLNGWYVDKAIKTVALPEIKEGRNELVVKVPFGKRTNTEWCYILGEFGVKTCGAVLTIIPDTYKIGFSTLTAQGMPFYGGNIIYKTEIDVRTVQQLFGQTLSWSAIKVFVDGKDMGIIAFFTV